MNLKVGIHTHMRGQIGPFSKKYIKILEFNNIPYIILDASRLEFWIEVKSLSHFIFNWGGFPDHHQIAKTIMPIIESHFKIPIFPDGKTTWQQDDKIRQFLLLKSHNYPIIESYIFWDKNLAMTWIKENAKFPLVFKLKSSAGSQDVVLVESTKYAIQIIKKMFGQGIVLNNIPGNWKFKLKNTSLSKIIDRTLKTVYRKYKNRDINYYWKREKNYVLFQSFLPNNKFDTRITIIGNRAFAFRRFNRKNDFRSSGSGIIDYQMDQIDNRFIRLAFDISSKYNFQSMAYDFLYDENDNPALCEISYTYQDLAIYNCPGYWDRQLNWIEGHFWPQYAHLQDFLELPDLKNPWE